MRIIGGTLRGRQINPPAGYKARPTTDFAKEGLFNTLGNEYYFEDLAVLEFLFRRVATKDRYDSPSVGERQRDGEPLVDVRFSGVDDDRFKTDELLHTDDS